MNRRVETETLDQPVLVVESTEVLESLHQFRDRLEVPGPEQLLLERFEEAFDTALAFGLANERRRRFHAQETDLILEVVAHELRAVIVPESKSSGGVSLEASEVFMDALPEWLHGLEARRSLDGMNAHTLGRAMVDGGEHGDLAVVERHGCRGVDAPHLIRAIGGDGRGVGLLGGRTAWR